MESFWKRSVKLTGMVSDRRGQERSVWILPDSLCAMLVQKSTVPGGRQGRIRKWRSRSRKATAQFIVSRKVPREKFRKHALLREVALRNIKSEKELFVHYVEKYLF